MNNSQLTKLLKSVPAPERSPEFWEQLPGRISAKVYWREMRRTGPDAALRHPQRVAWGISLATVCLLVGFAFVQWRGTEKANEWLRNERLIREVLGMFPNQIQAIVQDESGLRLVLADEPNVPESTPLWVKICEVGHCRSIVTFSGQTLQIAGQRVEVLADARGDVMLVGDHFFWSAGNAAPKNQLRIDARQLRYSL